MKTENVSLGSLNPGVWVLANKFRGRGDAIQNIFQAIGKRLNNILDIEVYPPSVNWNVRTQKGLVWDQVYRIS